MTVGWRGKGLTARVIQCATPTKGSPRPLAAHAMRVPEASRAKRMPLELGAKPLGVVGIAGMVKC